MFDNEVTVEMVGIKNEREVLLIKVWWNLAIETASNTAIMEYNGVEAAEAIRKLKK